MTVGLYVFLLVLVGAAAAIDCKSHHIPNWIAACLMAAGTIKAIVMKGDGLYELTMGLFGIGGLLLAVHYLSKGAIGMGDVKLLSAIGLLLGFWDTILIMLIASTLSGLASLLLIALRKVNRKSKIPFAPFIFISILISLGEKQLM